ncbi:DUF5691 domain-containing protein [Blastococcus litoris]|uniref:DUF5691 domain-containing protein n=1 Tax=Blastococcus litoris TaxID=2171622 RepID=UPI000E301FE4|nr:DUF5691 domain-containing protein [Blastococcus litoris]
MTGWEDLTATALLGTARRAVDLTGLPEPVAVAAGAPGDRDPATTLLDAAALAVPYRRAGRRPAVPAVTPGEAAPDDDVPEIGPAASARLASLTSVPQGPTERLLLVEWLGAAAAAGRGLPPRALPVLLDLATRDAGVAATLGPVLGSRGRWLAAYRPDWARLLTAGDPAPGDGVPADPAALWATGVTGERRTLFARLRTADPDLARELLTGSWGRETVEDREAFLDALAPTLSPADEPLLETALDDRRTSVRERAVPLLQRLPGSAYARRAAERARPVVLARTERSGTTLAVAPPAAVDRAAVRDGVRVKPPLGTGERAWWARQVVAAAPLSLWPALTGLPVERLVRSEVADGWRDVLLGAWTDAAVAQRDRAWARALLGVAAFGPDGPRLVRVLDRGDRAGYVAAAVGDHLHRPSHATTDLLAACPGPWPDVLADRVAAWLVRPAGPADDWTVRERLRLAAHRLPVHHAAALSAAAARQAGDSPWRAALSALSDTLSFRHDMLEELR